MARFTAGTLQPHPRPASHRSIKHHDSQARLRLHSNQIAMRVSLHKNGFLVGATLLNPTTKAPKCYRFSGVPYASPPIGTRRWQKPEPLPANYSYGSETNPGVFKARSTICPQLPQFIRSQSSDEDCLQCNIWVPLGTPPEGGWPVLFYIRRFNRPL